MPSSPYAILQVLSNVLYALPIWYAYSRRLYFTGTVYLMTMLVSAVYHVCADLVSCSPLASTDLRVLDHFTAAWAVGATVIFVFYVDLIERRYVTEDVPRPKSRRYKHRHRREVLHKPKRALPSDDEHYVLARHALYSPVMVGNIMFILISVLFLLDTGYEFVLTGSYNAAIALLALVLHWDIKRRTARRRFRWDYIALGLLLIAGGFVVFFFETHETRDLHALWHALGALGLFFLLMGSAQHLREFRHW